MLTSVMVELLQVEIDDARLARLLQLYMHEWSGLVPMAIDADAQFVYDELPLYADRETRAAYLLVDGSDGLTPLGFALIQRDAAACHHVEEFFVVAGARRRGARAPAPRRLFAARPGPWTLTVRPENPAGLAFWRAVAPDGEAQVDVGADGVARTRLSFVVVPGGPAV